MSTIPETDKMTWRQAVATPLLLVAIIIMAAFAMLGAAIDSAGWVTEKAARRFKRAGDRLIAWAEQDVSE